MRHYIILLRSLPVYTVLCATGRFCHRRRVVRKKCAKRRDFCAHAATDCWRKRAQNKTAHTTTTTTTYIDDDDDANNNNNNNTSCQCVVSLCTRTRSCFYEWIIRLCMVTWVVVTRGNWFSGRECRTPTRSLACASRDDAPADRDGAACASIKILCPPPLTLFYHIIITKKNKNYYYLENE